ncbi:hypothetical protein R1sor_000101 [Riccia sorocarpa]|uniref:tRNA-uridine aminocarboxypropyltransferase n=1 Tax=Riccia sorocarpa TaxID=122646 RepID=A0ABD3GUN3_9MARC
MPLEALCTPMLSSVFAPFHGAVVLRAMGGRRFPTISLQKDFVAHCDRASVLVQIESRVENGAEAELDCRFKTEQANNSSGKAEEDKLLLDWQLFCKHYPLPPRVRRNMEKIKDLETEFGEELKFGGPRGSLKGRPGAEEDYRHREFYETLNDSEAKLQEFTARQVACRVIGSTGYLCETCWLPERDCMCECFDRGELWPGICIWVYMHPKDFLRKNNTGKLLWQVFGHKAARLTVYGIREQEEIMWNAFREAGSEKVWCIYPHPPEFEVPDVKIPEDFPSGQEDDKSEDAHRIHIVLIDGTWSNSKAMISRLRERATSLWEGRSIPCVALSPTDVSPMHNLRPQPSTERTCTAGAAAQLLRELSVRQELAGLGLDRAAYILDASLATLQDALVTRRRRVGRTTQRFGRIRLGSPDASATGAS